MKKIAIIGVLIAFLLNTMGYFVVFKYNQRFLKMEMMSRIRCGSYHGAMILLKILKPEENRNFRRVEKSEFAYFGKLYDVVVERKNGDTTLFYCLHDKKEETLLADFSLFLTRTGRRGSSHNDNPFQSLLHNIITQALIHITPLPVPEKGTKLFYPELNPLISPGYLIHFAPPPESA